MDETGLAVVAIVCGFLAYMLVFNASTALVGAALGARIERIQFGAGPSILLFRTAGAEVRLGPILLSGFVKFAERPGATGYAAWPSQAAIALAGPAAAFAAASIAVGAEALREFLLTWPQMWTATVDVARVDPVAALQPALASGSFAQAISIVIVKFAAFNLLPLPVLSGGAFLLALVEGLAGGNVRERLSAVVVPISLIAMVAWVIWFGLRSVTGI